MAYVLVVDILAVGSAVGTAFLRPVTTGDLVKFAVLTAAACVYIEITRSVERHREFISGAGPYLDSKSVWSFAAVIVLPPVLATAMVVLTYVVAWLRIWPHRRPVEAYRWVFSAATVLLGTEVAVVVLAAGMHSYPGLPSTSVPTGVVDLAVVAAAAVVRWAFNYGLVVAAILISSPQITPAKVFSNIGDQWLEAGALAFGLIAAVLVALHPMVLASVVIALVAMHRGVLVVQYRHAARHDAKTGLMRDYWWIRLAQQALDRARVRGTGLAVLLLDLDHFKQINDRYGHVSTDYVLRCIADALASETRDCDMVGRYGGEEFVVLIGTNAPAQVESIAERIRRRIGALVIEVPSDTGRPRTPAATRCGCRKSPGRPNPQTPDTRPVPCHEFQSARPPRRGVTADRTAPWARSHDRDLAGRVGDSRLRRQSWHG